jgi:hypothetical protein
MADIERNKLLYALKLADDDGNSEAVQEITSMLQEYDAGTQQAAIDARPRPMVDTQLRGIKPQSGAALAKIGEGLQDVFGPEGLATSEGIKKRQEAAKFGFAKDPELAIPLSMSRMMTAFGDALIEGAKPFVEPVISAAKPYAKEASQYLPVVQFANILSESETLQPLIDLAKESYSDFTEELKNYPEEAKVLQATVDTVSLISPPARLEKLSDTGSFFEDTGMNLIKGGRAQVKGDKRKLVKAILDPQSKHGRGRTTIEGPLRAKVYHPLQIENEGIDVLTSLDSVKPNQPYTTIFNTVSDEIAKTRRNLDNRIQKAGNPTIELDVVLKELNKNADLAIRHPQIIGNVQDSLKKIVAETQRQLAASDGTALGLLNARRKVDEWIESSRGGAFDSEYENAITAGRRVVADTLNTLVNDAVPSANVDKLLRKQMLMYQARGVIEQKALAEANIGIGRAMQRVELVTGAKFPTTPLAMVATGGAGASLMVSGVMPYLAVPMVTVASGYGLTRLSKSPTTKKTLGHLLVGIGKAQKMAKGNAQVLADLRADKALVSSLLAEMRSVPEQQPLTEEQKQPAQQAPTTPPQAATQQTGQAAQIAGTIQNLRGFNQLPPQQVNARLGQLNDPMLQQAVMQQLYGTTP